MKISDTKLPGVILIEPQVTHDERGFFYEVWNEQRFRAAGLDLGFVQDNLSYSTRGTLRGLHFQFENPQGKLVSVLRGAVYDVAVDIRPGSRNYGRWVGVTLSAENKCQLYIPPGFAHGFCVTKDDALLAYKCTDRYNPLAEGSVLWSDAAIGIDWPVSAPLLSARDAEAPPLAAIDAARLSRMTEGESVEA